MRIAAIVLVAAGFLAGCRSVAPQRPGAPRMGARLPCRPDPGMIYGFSSADMGPGCTVTVDGIRYFVAGYAGRVAYIRTRDPAFESPEGLTVGASLEQVRAVGGTERIGEVGWAFYSRLPSGWRAEFAGFPDNGPLRPEGILSNIPGSTVVAFSSYRE